MKKSATIEAVKEKVARAQEQLEAQLAALQTSDDWRRTLECMAILGPTSINRFSFRNLMLLLAQRPTVRNAATFNAWHRIGRHVRKGEKALTVLRPRIVKERSTNVQGATTESTRVAGFSYLTVFALEQTDGEPIPEPVRPQNLDTPEGWTWTVDAMRDLVKTLPGVAGITLRHRGAEDHPAAAGWYELRTREIVVILGETSPAQQLKTLMHEVAHSILHGDGEHHATPTAEVEAESTAFVVAHALGFDTSAYSLPYVATWALAGDQKQPTKAVAAAGERIRKAAGAILAVLVPEAQDDNVNEQEAA